MAGVVASIRMLVWRPSDHAPTCCSLKLGRCRSGSFRSDDARAEGRIDEAADRRHTASIASVTLWALLCGGVVVAVHAATGAIPGRLRSYRSGISTLPRFVVAAAYSAPKRTMWLSESLRRLATRLPASIARRLIRIDHLKRWGTVHIPIGVKGMLPFWWPVE